MTNTILTLIKLQELDNRIARSEEALTFGPERLSQARETLVAAELKLSETREKFAVNAKRRRELEAESADLTARKTINQTRQLKAKSNEEYRAVLKEAEYISTQLSTRDDELLNLMDEGEKLEALLPELEETLKQEETTYAEKSQAIEKELANDHHLLEEAQAKRTTIVQELPPGIISRYQTVAKNRSGQVMAPVVDGHCQICRLSIPPQIFNELQRNDKIMICPNCARIIYWRDHPDFANPDTLPATPLANV